jgi:hypothetical protein
MSAYGKVTLAESDNVATEELQQVDTSTSVVDSQVEKFDNSYSIDKLQELYNEYDKITIDEEKIKSLTQVKTNAVSAAVPFRVALLMTTSIIVALLLAFLCIYNITVINGMGSSINYLQEEVVSMEANLAQVEGLYEMNTNPEVIKNKLEAEGYVDMSSSGNIVAIEVPGKAEVEVLEGSTNWFDAFCNFLSQIFG